MIVRVGSMLCMVVFSLGAFQAPIDTETKNNTSFRKVLYTGNYAQPTVMSILAGEDIGKEIHRYTDQIFLVFEGTGQLVLDGKVSKVDPFKMIIVPAGVEHNIINTGTKELKLLSIYAPPLHKPGAIHATKKEAELEEGEHP